MRISDWSSDVCSSDLRRPGGGGEGAVPGRGRRDQVRPRQRRPAVRRHRHAVPRPRAGAARRGAAHQAGRGARLHDGGRPPARSEEHTSELQSLMRISYAVFCLKKKTKQKKKKITHLKRYYTTTTNIHKSEQVRIVSYNNQTT